MGQHGTKFFRSQGQGQWQPDLQDRAGPAQQPQAGDLADAGIELQRDPDLVKRPGLKLDA